MRVLLNGLVVARGGHRTYFKNIIQWFGTLAPDSTFYLLYSPWQKKIFDYPLPGNFEIIIDGPGHRAPIQKIAWEQIHLPRVIIQHGIEVMFSPTPATSFRAPCPMVIAIRNPNLFSMLKGMSPQYYIRNLTLRYTAKWMINHSAYSIFVSNFSKEKALEVINVDRPDSIKVVHHGIGDQFFIELPNNNSPYLENVKKPYLLTVSNMLVTV